MGDQTKIEWTAWRDAAGKYQPGYTFNPWIGCTKVSEACANCYAEVETFPRVQRSRGVELWGKGMPRHLTSDSYWRRPLHWAGFAPTNSLDKPRVFCASLSDWLDDEVPAALLFRLLTLIFETPALDWLLLTKRPENWEKRIKEVIALVEPRSNPLDDEVCRWLKDWLHGHSGLGATPDNIWLGTTAENQQRANERIPHLLNIPAPIHFVSIEPILGEIDLTNITAADDTSFKALRGLYCRTGVHSLERSKINWVIVGGESGQVRTKLRESKEEWFTSIIDQCRQHGTPCFVKQLGARFTAPDDDYHCPMDDIGKDDIRWGAHFKHPKGGDMAEWPQRLRVRQFPSA